MLSLMLMLKPPSNGKKQEQENAVIEMTRQAAKRTKLVPRAAVGLKSGY